jgi:predicted RNase H-like nuclease (RuvC/YqgF family)
MSDYNRLTELADRSISVGAKAEHVSCSEMHEIRDGVFELIETISELKAENVKLKSDIAVMIQKAAAKHLPAYREQGEQMLALVESNEEKDKRIDQLEQRLDNSHEMFLMWRGICTEAGDVVCKECSGSGIKSYANTSTYHHSIGGQAITCDVCDGCWGSGKSNEPFKNLKGSR